MAASNDTYLEIQNDRVRKIQRTVIEDVPLSALYPHLETRVPVFLPTLPRSAVAVNWDETNVQRKTFQVLCELPPAVRNIIKVNRRYRLAFPWTYFLFTVVGSSDSQDARGWEITENRVFHARNRYVNIDSEVITARTPNVYRDGRICFGSTGVDAFQPLADRLDQLVNEWYETRFNNDLNQYFQIPNGDTTLRNWVAASATNPGCWMDWSDWETAEKWRVRDLMTQVLPDRRDIVLEVQDRIPDMQMPFTLGRAEEWIRTSFTPEQVRIFGVAMDIVRDGLPETPVVEGELPVEAIEDDGGVPVA